MNKILPAVALRDTVVYPGLMVPLFVGREKSVDALNSAVDADNMVILLTQKDGLQEDPGCSDVHKVGIVATVLQLLRLPDGAVKALIKGGSRVRVNSFIDGDKQHFLVEFEELVDDVGGTTVEELEGLRRSVIVEFDNWRKLGKKVQVEVVNTLRQSKDVGYVADVVASYLGSSLEKKQEVLEALSLQERLELVYEMLISEISILDVQKRLKQRVRNQMEDSQKVYYLNEQMRAIQKELGEGAEGGNTATVGLDPESVAEFEKRINEIALSEEALEKVKGDLRRYRKMNPVSPEATVISGYLNWILDLPWEKYSDARINLEKAEEVLNSSHYGMKKVKERILEYIAVHKNVRKVKGPILCLVGSPGVGKTSIGESMAKALGRKFVRIALGGVRDESEIRGHRRTYVASMPGRIIQGLKKAKVCNPVILLDEIDKMDSDYRGDPVAALLEVLDPEHNKHFVDHYMEVEFDLSNVVFVATANTTNMSQPLLDRMEVIELEGYTEDEKLKIAQCHLIPKLCKEHGLVGRRKWSITDDAVRTVIRSYTRESGVRGLEKELAKLMRKAVRELLTAKDGAPSVVVDLQNLEHYLSVYKYRFGLIESADLVGVVTGLAYTESGGDILKIETTVIGGAGKVEYTGRLGDVMKESVQAAYSYAYSFLSNLGWDLTFLEKRNIHVHVPDGAVPKDGPSAGLAIALAIISRITNIPVCRNVAMTGEITLRGRILPIGGLKEKLLAAIRAGNSIAILPKENEKDIKELPEKIHEELKLIFVDSLDEALKVAFVRPLVVSEQKDSGLSCA